MANLPDEYHCLLGDLRGRFPDMQIYADAPRTDHETQHRILTMRRRLASVAPRPDTAAVYERTHWLVLAELCTTLAGVAAVPATQTDAVSQTFREVGPIIRRRLDAYLRTHDDITTRRDSQAMAEFIAGVRESKREKTDPKFAYLFE